MPAAPSPAQDVGPPPAVASRGSCRFQGNFETEWHSRGHAAILHTIWEDDDHLLAIVFENEQWAVLRLGVDDGSVAIAVAPVADQDGQGAFVLPTG